MHATRRHGRLLLAVSLLTFLVAVSHASADMLEDKLQQTRSEAKQTKAQMRVVDHRQDVLKKQLSVLNERVGKLNGPLQDLETQVGALDYRIQRREIRIAELKQDRARQARDLVELQGQFDEAQKVLQRRVVAAYVSGDTGMMEGLVTSGTIVDFFQRQDALERVVGVDQRVIDKIDLARRRLRAKRAQNFAIRQRIRADITQLERDRVQVDARRREAKAARDQVAQVKAERDAKLRELNAQATKLDSKLDSLEEDAKTLREVIRTGQATYAGQANGMSSSGFIWPCNAPVVSPFGWRWGRMHEGVDIACGTGTPLHASASGIVTYASWMSGYGNMVLIQHAGGIVTGYGHQSQIATHVGAAVQQGQVIGFVGCTGHCFGPHVHFETRIGESPQDPMRYLR